MSIKEGLLAKIAAKTLKMGVIGLGYVGLPLAVEKAKAGFRTIGFDVQAEKVAQVNRGENYIGDVVAADLEALVASGQLQATSDFAFVSGVDFVAICVPTPLDLHGQPDLSYLQQSSRDIGRHLRRGMVVVLESTTYPGTTEELIKPILEGESGLVCGQDFYLGFSPERVDPGNAFYKTKNTPKVVGALGAEAREVIAAVYSAVIASEIHCVSSPAVAEMEKILENTYRNINIALVNELAMLCEKMQLDIWEVIEAAKTKPYGFQAFYPGPGLGGHCIPLDPCYLSWKAKEYGFHTSMIETAMMINDGMPDYVRDRAARILNERGLALKGSKLLILGLAYKKDVADYRESPALLLIERLRAAGAEVSAYDPHVPAYKFRGVWQRDCLASLSPEQIKAQDLVLICTDHTAFDYEQICSQAQGVFDTRNACRAVRDRSKITLL